jgi:hypothetical protein
MLWQRPNIGSRVNREVHARFWERAAVKLLRATRQSQTFGDVRVTSRFSACAPSTASPDPEAYDISATVDDYFLKRSDAPYCGQAHCACANSSNIVCPHLNICFTKFGRDAEFR